MEGGEEYYVDAGYVDRPLPLIMFKEFDTVILKKSLGDSVPVGSIGAILMIFTDEDEQRFYEVEFVDENGCTLDVLTVAEADLSLKQ